MKLLSTTKQAYSEVNEIINLLDEYDRKKIPLKLKKYFEDERDKEYTKKIDLSLPIKEQNLKRETLAIMAMLNLKYICVNENEKAQLNKKYIENEEKYQKELSEKYNVDNIFKNNNEVYIENKEDSVEISKEQSLIIKKEGILKKIVKFIKNIFKK